MEFLKIRRGTGQKRADGSGYAVPLYVTKTQRMGNTISEEAISTKRPILGVFAQRYESDYSRISVYF